MAIHNEYDENEVVKAIASSLEAFYTSLISKIDSIDITDIMKRKNEIFMYIQKYYRSFMKNKDVMDLPLFEYE